MIEKQDLNNTSPLFAQINDGFYVEHRNTSGTEANDYYFHYHDSYEIYYLVSGKKKYCINNTYYDIDEGTIVLIKPNIFHTTYSQKPTERELLHFNTKVLRQYFGDRIQSIIDNLFNYTILTTTQTQKDEYLSYFKNLHEDHRNNNYDLFAYHFLGLIISLNRIAISSSNSNLLSTPNRFINYITNNYKEDESLDDIAKKFNISKFYLCHIFKKEVGISINKYKTRQKIISSANLLATTDKKIKEIALDCGFNSETFFCKTFYNVMKITPSQYRKTIKNTQE